MTAKERRALKQLYAPEDGPRWTITAPVSRPRLGEDPRMALSLPARPAANRAYRVVVAGADVLLTDNRHLALQRFMADVVKWANLGKAQIFCDGVEYPLLELKRMP